MRFFYGFQEVLTPIFRIIRCGHECVLSYTVFYERGGFEVPTMYIILFRSTKRYSYVIELNEFRIFDFW